MKEVYVVLFCLCHIPISQFDRSNIVLFMVFPHNAIEEFITPVCTLYVLTFSFLGKKASFCFTDKGGLFFAFRDVSKQSLIERVPL